MVYEGSDEDTFLQLVAPRVIERSSNSCMKALFNGIHCRYVGDNLLLNFIGNVIFFIDALIFTTVVKLALL